MNSLGGCRRPSGLSWQHTSPPSPNASLAGLTQETATGKRAVAVQPFDSLRCNLTLLCSLNVIAPLTLTPGITHPPKATKSHPAGMVSRFLASPPQTTDVRSRRTRRGTPASGCEADLSCQSSPGHSPVTVSLCWAWNRPDPRGENTPAPLLVSVEQLV